MAAHQGLGIGPLRRRPRPGRLRPGRRRVLGAVTLGALLATLLQAPAARAAGGVYPVVDSATLAPWSGYAAAGIQNLTGNTDPAEPALATPASVTAVAGPSGLQSAPVLRSDLGGSALAAVPIVSLGLDHLPVPLPLSTLPLKGSAGWDALLEATPLAGAPLVGVTWSQVAALTPRPAAVAALTVGEVDWSGSLLRDLPLAAFVLGGSPLTSVDLPTRPGADPAAKWCDLLNEATPGSCPTPSWLSGQTLLSAGVAGADLKDLPLKSIPLKSIDLSASPLKSIPLKSIVLTSAPLKSIPLKSIDLAASPLKSIPLKSIDLSVSPLKSIPLKSIDWQASPLKSIPLKSIDLSASPLKSIPLKSIDWGVAGIGALPLSGFAIPGSPLAGIPLASLADAPSVAGCAGPAPSTCAPGATLGDAATTGDLLPTATLRAVGGTGFATAGVTLADLMAAATTAVSPTLGDLRLDLLSGPQATALLLGAVLLHLDAGTLDTLVLGDIGVFTTETGHDITLGELGTWTLPGGDITLGDLAAYLPDSISLADVLLGLIPASAFPYENFPFASLGLDDPMRTSVTPYSQTAWSLGADATPQPHRADFAIWPLRNPSTTATEATTLVVTLPVGARPMGVEIDDVATPSSDEVQADGRHRVTVANDPIPPQATRTLKVSWMNGALLQAQDARLDVLDRSTGAVQSSTTQPLPAISDGQEPNTPQEYLTRETFHSPPAASRVPSLPTNPRGCPMSATSCVGYDTVSIDALASGHVSHAGDVDWFKIPGVRAGTRLSADLTNLPLDADLVLYGPAGIHTSPSLAPTSAQGLPGSLVEDPGLGVGQSARSLALSDLAALRLDPGYEEIFPPSRVDPLTPLSISQHRGTENESVGTIAPVDGDYVVQVSGYNTETSPAPYVLRVRGLTPTDPTICTPRTFAHATPTPAAAPAVPADANTVFLTNPSRLAATFGQEAADLVAAELQATVDDLVAHPARGIIPAIVPVDAHGSVQAAYAQWDASPCSVPAANAVTAAITGVLTDLRAAGTTVDYVTIVGGDDVIPMGRVPDLTRIANESEYAATFRGVDNPFTASTAGGHTLTDDPYGDPAPKALGNGDSLFLPQASIGRLVEAPAEIASALAAYRSAGGTLDTRTGLVTGYDFLSDGAAATADRLRSPGRTIDDSLVDPPGTTPGWSSADLLAALFPGGQASPLVASVNAHYDHGALLSAAGEAGGSTDLVTTGQVATLAAQDAGDRLAGRLLFTMGCHSGLSVPEAYVSGTAAASTSGGWARTLASAKVAVYVANTGFGIGDSGSTAYTERLMALYAKLLDGSVTAGQALTYAKQAYYGSLGALGVYDTKILQQSTFYGLPFWQVDTGAPAPGPTPPPELPGPLTTDPATGLASITVSLTPSLQEVSTDRGRYWTANGADPQVTHLQPTQPRMTLPVGTSDLIAHGALIGSLTSHDVMGVRPLVATPVVDTAAAAPPVRAEDAAWPASIATITSSRSPSGPTQDLVLMPGQFTGSTRDGTGVQRLFDSVGLSVLYSPETTTDFGPPTVAAATGSPSGSGIDFTVTSEDPTPGGTVRQVRVGYQDGDGSWHFTDLTRDPSSTANWTGSGPVTGSPTSVRFFVQSVDAAGNVGVATGKVGGFLASADTTAPTITATVSPAPNADGWITTERATVTFTCSDAGSGIGEDACPAPVEVLPEGSTTVSGTVRDRAGNSASTTIGVRIDRTPPRLTSVVTPGGWSSAPSATVSYACSDDTSGLVGACPGEVTVTAEGTTPVQQSVSDRAGNTSTVTDQVRLDRTAPTLTATLNPAANPAGWVQGTSATVSFTCTDAGSGVASTCPSPVVVAEGERTVTGEASDAVGNTGSTSIAARVDGTAPTVTIVGTVPNLQCHTTDALSGVATAATGSSATTGSTTTFTCAGAIDLAGNPAPPVTTTVAASLGFSWYRSLAAPPNVNVWIRGLTIPGQFRLTRGGVAVTDPGAVAAIEQRSVRCLPWAGSASTWQPAPLATGAPLRYDTTLGAFQFGWKAPRTPGCHELRVRLVDGSGHVARVVLL